MSTVEQPPVLPRDAGFLARCDYLVCPDCGGEGHSDEGECEACENTGGIICMCCDLGTLDRLAVTVMREGRWKEPVCRPCAEHWSGRIEQYDTAHELEDEAPVVLQRGAA